MTNLEKLKAAIWITLSGASHVLQLADVLRAVDKNYWEKSKKFGHEDGRDYLWMGILRCWDLTKDLDGQSPEVWQLLLNIFDND